MAFTGGSEAMVDVLKALADPTRLAIIEYLQDDEKTPKEIQDALNKSQSAISQQLKLLLLANILVSRKDGSNRYYRVKNQDLFSILKAVSHYLGSLQKENFESLATKDIKDILMWSNIETQLGYRVLPDENNMVWSVDKFF